MPFLTVGDPDPDTSLQLICELEAAGADIVELGVPYSDPLADGPVIQRASERALAHGITLLDCIAIARQARKKGSRSIYPVQLLQSGTATGAGPLVRGSTAGGYKRDDYSRSAV